MKKKIAVVAIFIICLSSLPGQVKAQSNGYLLGAYYMPKPMTPTHQWNDLVFFDAMGTIKGTNRILLPALGFYNNSDPRVLTWQIQSSVEHGLNYFIFDDYWVYGQSSPVYNTAVSAFLKATNRNLMKFAAAIIGNSVQAWSDPSQPNGNSKTKFTTDIANYYKNNYFNQPNYLRINGLPVVPLSSNSIVGDWDPARIKNILSAFEATAGTKVYWVYIYADQAETGTQSSLQNIAAMGFSAIAPYGLTPVSNVPEGYTGDDFSTIITSTINANNWFLTHAGNYGLKFIPSASSYFDERPREAAEPGLPARSYTKNPTLDGYKTILTSVKQMTDQNLANVPQIDGQPLVTLAAYNEWFESLSLEPGLSEIAGQGNQFAVLDAVKGIYAPGLPAPANQLPDPSISQSIPEQTTWTVSDMDKIFTEPRETNWTKDTAGNLLKSTIYNSGSFGLSLAANTSLAGYNGVALTFKASCPSGHCLQSIFTTWHTFPSGNSEPALGSAGVGFSECITSPDGWTTCKIVPGNNTHNPLNPGSFAGNLFYLGFNLFLNNSFPTDIYLRQISLLPSTSPADFNNDGKVDINDYNLLLANFGHPYTIFDYNDLAANFGK